MAARKKLSQLEIGRALIAANGIIGYAARFLGVSRALLKRRIQADPDLQAICGDIELCLIDLAWKVFEDGVMDGDLRASMVFLDRRGASRGYGVNTAKVRKLTDDEVAELARLLRGDPVSQRLS